MFFLASKVLMAFVYPLGVVCCGLLVVLLGYRRRWGRGLLAVLCLSVYGLSTPGVVLPLVRWLEGPPPGLQPPRSHYDVAIVLTGMVDLRRSRPGQIAFNAHVERILEGIRLVKQGVADKLLIVGGSGSLALPDASEARLLRPFVLDCGLRDDQVLTEETSRNTYENAVNAAALLRAGPYRDLVLITSALHMPRSIAVFHKQGLTPDTYAVDFQTLEGPLDLLAWVPSAQALALMTAVVHEWLGRVIYHVQGYS